MAKDTITRLTDDLDGSGSASTVRFGWDGVGYEIDLNAGNAQTFRAAFEPYLRAGRRVTGTARRSPARRVASAAKVDLNVVRQWASANGHAVAARGRIAATIVEAFHAAQRTLTDPGAANGATTPTGSPRTTPAKAASRTRAAVKTAPRTGLNDIRAWAARNGHKVADRGRIPTAILEAFHSAQAANSDAVSPQQSVAMPANKAAPRKRAAKKAVPRNAAPSKPAPRKAPVKKAAAKRAAAAAET